MTEQASDGGGRRTAGFFSTSWLWLALLLAPLQSAAAAGSTLRALLVEYRCAVVDRLERIYEAGDRARSRNRYLAITAPDHPHGYVQCLFYDGRAKLLCEASSGFYYHEPRTFFLHPDAIAALGRLGFSTDDSEGNFRIELDLADPPDFNAIADLMLRALHDASGARAGDAVLLFNAPFARRPSSTCVPVS